MKKQLTTILFSLAVLVIAALACQLPFGIAGSQPTATAFVTETAAAFFPTATQGFTIPVDQPPALVETSPIADSVIGLAEHISLYFSQPMDRATVRENLRTEPSIDWSMNWQDDSTLEIVPAQSLPLSSQINITLDVGAQAANGLGFSQPATVQFRTVDSLQITEQLPRPGDNEVNPSAALMVSFNQPVVSIDAEGSDQAPAFTLNPQASGRGEWVNTSTYIFYPELSLAGGKQYTLNIDPQLTSLSGAPLLAGEEHPLQWAFTTTVPRLVSVEPALQGYLPIDAQFTLQFNQPMDPSSVQDAFAIKDFAGAQVEGEITWNDNITELTFKPDGLLKRNTIYALQVSKDARGAGGTMLVKDYSYTFLTIGELTLVRTDPSLSLPLDIYDGYSSFYLLFNAPLARQDLDSLIDIQPSIGDRMSSTVDTKTVVVSGYFSPNTGYTLTISPELQDEWGSTLREPYITTFMTAPAPTQLNIPIAQYTSSLFLTPEDNAIPALATNLDGIDLKTANLSLSDYIRLADSWGDLQDFEPTNASNWHKDLSLPSNRTTRINIPVRRNAGSLSPGLYYLKVSNNEVQYPPEPMLVVVSNVQITTKRSADRLFIWAVNVKTGEPLANTLMTVHRTKASTLINCTTDEVGICEVDLPPDVGVEESLYVVTGEQGKEDFGLSGGYGSQGISSWSFGVTSNMTRDTLMVYMYTDRPIYRPGQTVNFKAILRDRQNGRYSLPDINQIHLQIYSGASPDPTVSTLLTEIPIDLSEFGSATGSFDLPVDAVPGDYSIQISEIKYSWLGFQVAEYRKPEIDLQAEFSASDWIIGEDLQANIQAQYYFGSSAAGLPVHWALYTRADYLDLPYGYQVGKQDLSWYPSEFGNYFTDPLGTYVTEGDDVMGEDGTLQISIPYGQMEDRLITNQAQQITLEATIKDSSNLPTSIRTTANLHPDRFYIGIRPEQWSGSAGQELGYDIQTVDWSQDVWGDQPLQASFLKVSWVLQETGVVTDPQRYVPEYTQVSSATFSTNADGQARLTFTPDEPGMYLLEVKGGNAISQVISWVSGAGSAAWPNLPNQKLAITADADAYKAGETANIFIPNPFGGKVTALVTMERDWVMRSSVITFEDPQYQFSLPITNEDAPNIYLSVILIKPSGQDKPDFRMGILDLQVEPEAETLQVNVVPDTTKLEPGGEVTFTIQVSNYQGEPVKGEFSLALIDKALLALAQPNSQDILHAFYGDQPLGVTNSLSLVSYAGRIPYTPALGVGGGGGMSAETPVIRGDFEDTAYWNGQIVTGADGKANITLTLPDNLTTWVAHLKGITADSLVGEAENEIMTSKDLLIRPLVPGFVVAGDHVQLAAVVHNNTDQALLGEVSLQAAGFEFDDENLAMQRVSIPAGGQEKVEWWGTIQDTDRLELLYSANAGDLQDAVRPVQEGIPVLHYSAPQTFGTSGVLTEEGGKIEQVGLPRSYTPTDGALSVEMSPSLAAMIIDDLQVLKAFPYDVPEALVSRLLPNLASLQALQDLQVPSPSLEEQLTAAVTDTITRITRLQNDDGGWGWCQDSKSDPYFTSYVLFGLVRAGNSGIFVNKDTLKNAQDYLVSTLTTPEMLTQTWQLDRLVFQYYVLQESGAYNKGHWTLYDYTDRLNPWSQALLALLLEENAPGDTQITSLLDGLETSAVRTSTGAHWIDKSPEWQNLTSANFETAVVIYALAKLDPASPMLQQAVRYLVDGRNPGGGWGSSYETSWALLALTETMKGTGEYTASYDFSSSLNDVSIINGAASGADSLTSIAALVPLEDLIPTGVNTLRLNRSSGGGRLYYRAYLDIHKPITSAEAVQRGITIQRTYEQWGSACGNEICLALDHVSLSDGPQPFQVRLTLIIPEEMHYLVVEDAIPAGSQIVDMQLETTALGQPSAGDQAYDPYDPLKQGWGWWYFTDPQIYVDHIRWMAADIPAGTYQITYKLIPYLAGEYNVIPAHAYQYYFPEVEGSSAGEQFTINP